ncbi:MAG: hypothetical protein KGJ62_11340 [Armatimonadetes bacterium]|nr:hypothetical protein [Armatimonadota bacterium]MDE2207787.1 hypothetical protein [Armatimonadota bacterium]
MRRNPNSMRYGMATYVSLGNTEVALGRHQGRKHAIDHAHPELALCTGRDEQKLAHALDAVQVALFSQPDVSDQTSVHYTRLDAGIDTKT